MNGGDVGDDIGYDCCDYYDELDGVGCDELEKFAVVAVDLHCYYYFDEEVDDDAE